MTLVDFVRIVGEERLRAAVAEAMREAHPDHGGDPATAEARLAELSQAKAALTTTTRIKIESCVACGGRGIVPGMGFGGVKCVACNGSGDLQ